MTAAVEMTPAEALACAIDGARTLGMRVVAPSLDAGRCTVECLRCGWRTPPDVVTSKYAAGPHGCILCATDDLIARQRGARRGS